MGTKERRVRERQALRDKILDAARELFAEHGFEAVTMRAIAQRIEYSPTAIYLYFKDKSELIRELVTGDFLAFAAAFQDVGRIPDPLERLRAAGRTYIAFGLDHPHHYNVMFGQRLPVKDPDHPNDYPSTPDLNAYVFLRSLVVDAIAAGELRSELDDAELVAQILWAGVHGITSLLLSRSDSEIVAWRTRELLVENMLDTLMKGIAQGAPD